MSDKAYRARRLVSRRPGSAADLARRQLAFAFPGADGGAVAVPRCLLCGAPRPGPLDRPLCEACHRKLVTAGLRGGR